MRAYFLISSVCFLRVFYVSVGLVVPSSFLSPVFRLLALFYVALLCNFCLGFMSITNTQRWEAGNRERKLI